MQHTVLIEEQDLPDTSEPRDKGIFRSPDEASAHLVDFWEILSELRI